MSVALVVIGVALAVLGLLVTAAVLVVRDTVRKRGRWGINLQPAVCAQCGTPAPADRRPASLHQALWYGWTCTGCGLELDRWGQPAHREDLQRGDYRA